MEIIRYSKHQAIRLHQNWRAALREFGDGRLFGEPELAAWRERARSGLQFVHDGGTTSGSVQFDQDEPIPHPSELCERLELDGVWLFGSDFTWAVHAGHEDWDLAKSFERGTDSPT